MKQRNSKRVVQKHSQADPLKNLTWDDLQEWAGAAMLSRGQRYQRSGQVHDLARISRGGLVAWVQGTHRYATMVESEDNVLNTACTCPYGGICKHAVAVVLDYLEQVKQNRAIPILTEQDHRLRLLEDSVDTEEKDEEEDGDESDEGTGRAFPRRSRKAAASVLPEFLEQQTKPQLLALIKDMAQRYPDVRQFLQDRHNLSIGAVPKLVQAVRAEIAALSEEPGWSNHWNDEGSISDYSRVRDRLEALLAQGHADAVVDVGAELLEAGTRQVEMSHDEGETGEEIASCMDIVFRALPHSSRSPAEQMRWAVEADLSDDYELCRGAKVFWDRTHPAAAWNALAEQLTTRLAQDRPTKSQDNFSDTFRRDRLSNWLILSLERAGRDEEIIPLCRQEAERTGSYLRLVERLKKAKRWEEAELWIRKGIAATEKRWPGIACQLRASFIEMRKREQDWTRVAALHADDFFAEPSLQTFQTLQQAAKRAGVLPAVRGAAQHYLETGAVPQPTAQMAGAQTIPPWPLPDGGLKPVIERPPTHPPMTDILIDVAIAEKRPDEVLRWYDQRKPRPRGWDSGWFAEDRIAEAVMEAYPDRAVAIWKQLAEKQIALTKPKAYEEAAGYLRKVHRVQKQLGKEQDWQGYLASLRRANERKRRLVQILDTLSGRRIVESSYTAG
ncbi:MAG: SWIM zinc finger family protein [Nitrospira sp.]|nr:SWIM zinc finger family protein [Nitrospira sp.]